MTLLSGSVVAADCGHVDQTAQQWLVKMSQSAANVSYQGVFTYQYGTQMQALRISHSLSGGTATDVLTRLSGPPSQMVRWSHPLDCVHPGNRLLSLGKQFAGDDCGLAAHYRLSMAGEEMIAGRMAVRLQIAPRDMYRYGYQMAVDKETGLLLMSQTLGMDGKILERFQFADLSIGAVTPHRAALGAVHEVGHPPPLHADGADSAVNWHSAWVPAGFTLASGSVSNSAGITYTDGLAVFSVFLEPGAAQMTPGEGRARQGGTTAYTRGMNLAGRRVLVTVVGEIPVNTARMVADSVVWNP